MVLKKQLIMTIGMTQNNWELTKEMVKNSIKTFQGVPIVWNKQQEFKDYTGDMKDYKNEMVIGMILENGRVCIEDNNVYADIFLIEGYRHLWKDKFDNWCIQFSDDKKSFILESIEVF
jgi:hypothetical protein